MALTTAFVAAVRRQGSIPSNFADTDILGIGDEEIQGTFIPLLTSLRSNFFVRSLDVAPDSRGRVALPARAAGAALRSVSLSLNNGWVPLPQRDLGDADYVSSGALPDAYALDGGSIMLLPTGTTGTLRLRYPARPGKMVLSTDPVCKGITAVVVGASTTAITCVYSGSGAMVDIIASGPAHQHKAISAVLTGATPNWVITNVQLLETPIVGDTLGIFDQTIYVPLPEELFSALVHKVAANILLSQGYLEEYLAQEKKAQKATDDAKLYLMPRNEGNPKTVKGGILRALGGGSRRGRW